MNVRRVVFLLLIGFLIVLTIELIYLSVLTGSNKSNVKVNPTSLLSQKPTCFIKNTDCKIGRKIVLSTLRVELITRIPMLPLLPGRHVLDLRQGARANAPHPSPVPAGEGTARPTLKHRAERAKPRRGFVPSARGFSPARNGAPDAEASG